MAKTAIEKLEAKLDKKKNAKNKLEIEHRDAMNKHLDLLGIKITSNNIEAVCKSFINANKALTNKMLKIDNEIFTLELSLAHCKGGVI